MNCLLFTRRVTLMTCFVFFKKMTCFLMDNTNIFHDKNNVFGSTWVLTHISYILKSTFHYRYGTKVARTRSS